MSCNVCGPARGCIACTLGGELRRKADTDPAFRELFRSRWLAGLDARETEIGPAPGTAPVRDHFAPLRLARACDYSVRLDSGEPCGCASELRICLMGRSLKSDGSVSINLCIECDHGGPITH